MLPPWVALCGILSTSSVVLAGTAGTEPQQAAQDKNMYVLDFSIPLIYDQFLTI